MNSQARVKIIDPYFRRDGVRSASRSEYAMEFPVNNRWLRSISDRKKISIRKFSVYPENNYFRVYFGVTIGTTNHVMEAVSIWAREEDTIDLITDIRMKFNDWYYDLPGIPPSPARPEYALDLVLVDGRLVATSMIKMIITFTTDSQKLLNQVPYM